MPKNEVGQAFPGVTSATVRLRGRVGVQYATAPRPLGRLRQARKPDLRNLADGVAIFCRAVGGFFGWGDVGLTQRREGAKRGREECGEGGSFGHEKGRKDAKKGREEGNRQ